MALRVRDDIFDVETGIETEQIAATSSLVAERTGYAVQRNKAIVGANAFAHEAGIHQDGMLKDARTYQIIDPATVGSSHDAPARQALRPPRVSRVRARSRASQSRATSSTARFADSRSARTPAAPWTLEDVFQEVTA